MFPHIKNHLHPINHFIPFKYVQFKLPRMNSNTTLIIGWIPCFFFIFRFLLFKKNQNDATNQKLSRDNICQLPISINRFFGVQVDIDRTTPTDLVLTRANQLVVVPTVRIATSLIDIDMRFKSKTISGILPISLPILLSKNPTLQTVQSV